MKFSVAVLTDILMFFLLLLLMAAQHTGSAAHEWLGIALGVAFLLHTWLNCGWYATLTKGRYNVFRLVRLVLNALLLAAMIGTLVSAVLISRTVFAFAGLEGTPLSRSVHVFCAHWCFLLAAAHLGLYAKRLRAIVGRYGTRIMANGHGWVVSSACAVFAAYGARAFLHNEWIYPLTLRSAFMPWSEHAALFLLDYCAVFFLYAWSVSLLASLLRHEKTVHRTPQTMAKDMATYATQTTLYQESPMKRFFSTALCLAALLSAAPSQAAGEFVLIQGGTFEMGSPNTENRREKDEVRHRVTVSSFYMGTREVTQKAYRAYMNDNPSQFKGDDLPVENVSWHDAVAYCNARSIAENLTPAYEIRGSGNEKTVTWRREANGYRLPTEAEWEYACRAGTTTPFSTGENVTVEQANYYGTYPYDGYPSGHYRNRTVPAGSFAPNPWGLYDMHGNVWEWCWDWYGAYDDNIAENPSGAALGTYRVNRGGGWNDFGRHLRSAYRAAYPPDNKTFNLGFRLVRNAH